MGTEKDVGHPQVPMYTCTDGYTQVCMHRNNTHTKTADWKTKAIHLLARVLTWLQRVCAKQTTQVNCPNINCPVSLNNLGPAVFPKPCPLPGYSTEVQLCPRSGMFEGTLQIPQTFRNSVLGCVVTSHYILSVYLSVGNAGV